MEAKWSAQANKLWIKYCTKYLRREEICIYTIHTHRAVLSYRSQRQFLRRFQAAQMRISQRLVLRQRELSLKANPAKNIPYKNLVTNTIWHLCRNERLCLFLSRNQAHQQSRPVPALEALSSIVRPTVSPNEPSTALGRTASAEKRGGGAGCNGKLHFLPWGIFLFRFFRYLVGICPISSWSLLLTAPEILVSKGGVVLRSPVILLNGHSP